MPRYRVEANDSPYPFLSTIPVAETLVFYIDAKDPKEAHQKAKEQLPENLTIRSITEVIK